MYYIKRTVNTLNFKLFYLQIIFFYLHFNTVVHYRITLLYTYTVYKINFKCFS